MSEFLPSVSLIVLNYNGRQHLNECLPSLLQLNYPRDRLEVIVCDNGSTDGSADHVRQEFPEVRLVTLDRNHGFAQGNNLGAEQAKGDWVGFLNNDMWAPPDWLRTLVAPLAMHPAAASLASRIATWDGSAIDFIGGGVNFQGYGYQTDYGATKSNRDKSGRVLFACGGAMLVRRELFHRIGGFDPDYFIYYEDVDLGWRLNVLGHDVFYVSDATVNHRHHGTTAKWTDHRKRVLYDRNALFTMFKNLSDENLAVALPATLVLLNERALRSGGVDPAIYQMGPDRSRLPRSPSSPTSAEAASILSRFGRVLREEGPGAALDRVLARASRRVRTTTRAATRQVRSPRYECLPLEAAGSLVAISEFARRLDAMVEKRQHVQSQRCRRDEELLPLMRYGLEPSYWEPGYLQLHEWLCGVLELDTRFGRPPDSGRPD